MRRRKRGRIARVCGRETTRQRGEGFLSSKRRLILRRKVVQQVWDRRTGSGRSNNVLLVFETRRVGQRKRSRRRFGSRTGGKARGKLSSS